MQSVLLTVARDVLRDGILCPSQILGGWLSLERLVFFQRHPEETLDPVGADFDGKILNVHAPIGVAKGQFVKLFPVELLASGHCLPQLPELYRVSRCLASPRAPSGRLRLWQPLDRRQRVALRVNQVAQRRKRDVDRRQ